MIKKLSKYLLWLFILWSWFINFSYWLGVDDYNQDNAISWPIDNNNIQYIQTYYAYWPTYVWIDNWFNFHSKFIDEEMDLIWVVGGYNHQRAVLFRNDNILYNAVYYYNSNNPNSFSLSSLLKTTRISICDWTYNNCTKTDVSYFVNLQEQWIYFTDYYLNWFDYDNSDVLVICGKYSDNSSVCINWASRNGRSLFSDLTYLSDTNKFAPYTPSLYENLYFFTYIAEESPVPVHNSGGGSAWQRFPINNRRPVINWNTIWWEVLVEDTLEYYETVYKYNPNICFAGRDLWTWLQMYIPWSGANIFEVANYVAPIDSNYLRDYWESIYKSAVSSFYTSRFNKYESLNSVSTYNPFDSEIPALYNVVSNLYSYHNIRPWFFNNEFIDYCYLYLNYNTGDLYTWNNLNEVSQFLEAQSQGIVVDYTGSYYIIWLWYDFTGDSILWSLSWENQNLNLSDFFSSVSDHFTTIFNVNSYSTTWIIPDYILWFLVLFLLFKVLRK